MIFFETSKATFVWFVFRRFSCRGFLQWWYPQIIYFNRVFHYKPSILGYPCFRKHPCSAEMMGLGCPDWFLPDFWHPNILSRRRTYQTMLGASQWKGFDCLIHDTYSMGGFQITNSALATATRGKPWKSFFVERCSYHEPPKPTCLEVFVANHLVFRWPKHLFFIVLGAHGMSTGQN